MKVNPQIKATLKEISEHAIDHANNPGKDYRYWRRILRVFERHLQEEDRIFLFKTVFELVHYRNVMIDPDNLLTINNIKLRSYMFVFFLSVVAMIIAAALFKTNSALNEIFELLGRFAKMLSL